MTSLYVHILPGWLLLTLRWYGDSDENGGCGDSGIGLADMGCALLVYLAWQVAYFYKTEVVDRARLDADPEIATSLRWLTQDTKGAMYRLVRLTVRAMGVLHADEEFDHRTTKTKASRGCAVVFMTSQLLYTFSTMVLAPFLFRHFRLNLAYNCLVFSMALWNGSNYYIEASSLLLPTRIFGL
ncbi:unnamed protein product [Phaeothamnion confervicola]